MSKKKTFRINTGYPLSQVVRFRVSPSQRADLNYRAELSGLDLSEFLRQAAVSTTIVRRRDWTELVSLTAQVFTLLNAVSASICCNLGTHEALHLAAALLSYERALIEMLRRKAP